MHTNGSMFHLIRSGILFIGGLAGIGWETLVEQGERPTLLLLFAAMIGLPAFLAVDERRARSNKLGEKDGDQP